MWLDSLVQALEPWSVLYGNSTVLSAGLTFAHLGALMIGGGLAIGADRKVLRLPRTADASARRAAADATGDVHRVVVIALACSLISGLLQLAADIEALALSRTLWIKLGLVTLLLANGLVMLRDERALRRQPEQPRRLRVLQIRAATSVVLWLSIVMAGVLLMQG